MHQGFFKSKIGVSTKHQKLSVYLHTHQPTLSKILCQFKHDEHAFQKKSPTKLYYHTIN
eukprot:TRINITY_DN288_c0_g1_i1.p1 TRINITY_DN288_c0_g1~~TRINITY_DN288_c0_g1_i1.p1  ORF type:complete len:59 (-),score=1.91 TRINITY_DN288_c0_g1_i1:173-349(-)